MQGALATLTPLTLDEARTLGALYGLDVASMAPIPAGSVNTNVALSLRNGQKVFLRIYEEQGHEGAAVEAKLLTHLGGRGVKTAMPIARADGVPELWVPRTIVRVTKVPVLGTGKVDLPAATELARQKAST